MPRTRTRLTAVMAVLLVATVVSVSGVALALPVDPYAPYQPQTTCSPHPKPGALALSRWLQRTYPGSGSLGISRSCKDGGVSEHKEGRAFDWGVDVHSARDRGYVADFLHRIFATDADGDTHALARRMGIMYLIWNDHIYSSYYGFRARPYRPCRRLSSCSQTLRHRDHVHISLSRAGGAGRTTWYLEEDQPPILDLDEHAFARVAVPADGTTKVTTFRLEAGTRYSLTAAGLYGYGAPAQVADASCRWSGVTHRWSPYPSRATQASHGSLNLLVDGRRASGSSCSPGHVYRWTLTPTHTRTLRLRVANTAVGARGALTLLVSRPGRRVAAGLPRYPALAEPPAVSTARSGFGLAAETVSVPASRGLVRTAGSLDEDADYRLTVSGSVGLGRNLDTTVASDGRCVAVAGGWYRRVSLDRRFPDADHGRLYVDGRPFAGRTPSGATCGSRTHVLVHHATRTGRLELSVFDPADRRDDSGALSVQVQRLTPVATPATAATLRPAGTRPWRRTEETAGVDAGAEQGTVTRMRLRTGQTLRLVASGTDRSGADAADASCVRTQTGWHRRDPALAMGQDLMDLWVDGRRVAWHPVGARSGCSRRHEYRAHFKARKNGPVRLSVLDLDHRDDAGTLQVALRRD